MQFFRLVGKGQPDFEIGVGNLQIPELMLDDDGHLLRIAFLQIAGYADAGSVGEKGDVEVVIARQGAGGGDFAQDFANDASQGVLRQNVVSYLVPHRPFRLFVSLVQSHLQCTDTPVYGIRPARRGNFHHPGKVEASVARCLRTPPDRATGQEFI